MSEFNFCSNRPTLADELAGGLSVGVLRNGEFSYDADSLALGGSFASLGPSVVVGANKRLLLSFSGIAIYIHILISQMHMVGRIITTQT